MTDDLTPEQSELLGLLLAETETETETDADTTDPVAKLKISSHPGGPAPLSFAQRQLFLLEQMYPATAAYNVSLAMRLHGPLVHPALERSLATLVARNTALRTRFYLDGADPRQQVIPAERLVLPTIDLRHLAPADRDETFATLLAEELARPFDLARGDLLRPVLFALQPHDHILLLVTHHIIADALSMGLLAGDLITLYDAHLAGHPDPLPPPGLQMIDVAAHEQSHHTAAPADIAYWKHTLDSPPLLNLPTDRPRPVRPDFAGARLAFDIPRATADGLRALAREAGTTLYTAVLAAFQAVLARWAGHDDIIVGTPVAARDRPELERVFGFLVHVLALRTRVAQTADFRALLQSAHRTVHGAFTHPSVPFEQLVDDLKIKRDAGHNPVFQVSFALFKFPAPTTTRAGLTVTAYPLPSPTSKFDLTLDLWDQSHGPLSGFFEYSTALWDAATIDRLQANLQTFLAAAVAAPHTPLHALPLLSPAERHTQLVAWNATGTPRTPDTLHHTIRTVAAANPTHLAVTGDDGSLDYAALVSAADSLAARLHAAGVRRGDRVAICVQRGVALVIALLGALTAGAAYVPLDPEFPADRLQYMLADAGAAALISDGSHTTRLPDLTLPIVPPLAPHTAAPPPDHTTPADLAYVLYTSGSTGRPRGVAVTHRNVQAFFAGMDERLGTTPGVWLAVTSVSFDISVLELLWTLARGWTVVVQPTLLATSAPVNDLRIGLSFFASDAGRGPASYRLLLDGTRLADELGLEAVWTPERHFDSFGGIFPNPAVTAAALAVLTKRISLRAGSVVLPLHHPARVAEEWSVVDNLSNGRVELSFASGWHADDFIFNPGAYEHRKQHMLTNIDVVRRLWRGEPVEFQGGAGPVHATLHPRPVQPDAKIWLTAAGHPDTFRLAGERGFGVLTHLLGQDLPGLTAKIAIYRAAWQSAGHPGRGRVALMLHTLLADDDEAAHTAARAPFLAYLRQSLGLARRLAVQLDPAADTSLTDADVDALVDRGHRRLLGEAGLFGTPASALARARRLAAAGVDELACLIDFGVDDPLALAGIRHLAALQTTLGHGQARDIPAQIRRHGVTHLQCTPSLLRAIDPAALAPLHQLLLGGEPLPPELLHRLPDIPILNMYGPTETTIWSTCGAVRRGEPITLGRPIAGTRLYVVDERAQPVPIGVPGELWIGGAGVAAGYWNRPADSEARFQPDPFVPGERIYRTGDRVRYLADGRLQFLGRLDHQIKIRGHRVEPGEVEAVLTTLPGITQAVVHPRPGPDEQPRLLAWVIPDADNPQTSNAHVADWRAVWDRTWSEGQVTDATFDTTGWRSGIDGRPIPADLMREWVNASVTRILDHHPRRVLELGCGSGLLLFPLAAAVDTYHGTDLSPSVLARLRPFIPANVTLEHAPADAPPTTHDTHDAVILNSVVQYFPGPAYLRTVLTHAISRTTDGGFIYIGDVRNHSLLAHQAAATASATGLTGEQHTADVARRIREEQELLISPGFFHTLALPRIAAVQLLKRRGHATTEMSAYRYDVILHIGPTPLPLAPSELHTFTTPESLQTTLSRRSPRLRFTDLPDAHLGPGIHVEDLHTWASAANYTVDISPATSGDPTHIDATFTRHDIPWQPTHPPHPHTTTTAPLITRARRHTPAWSAALRDLLPPHLIPASITVLETLPLTPNGKVDRKALPDPDDTAHPTITTTTQRPPQTPTETTLARLFAETLGHPHVSTDRDFFEMGGHSLLAVHLTQRIEQELGTPVPLMTLFDNPTVQKLAALLDTPK